MKKRYILTLCCCLLFMSHSLLAQKPTQTVKGQVIDGDTQQGIPGATVLIYNADSTISIGTAADVYGNYRLEKVPVGRNNMQVSSVGYSPWTSNNVAVTSGKELILNVEMVEMVVMAETFVVTAEESKSKANNVDLLVSTRAFSVEQVQRTPASINDPGRMAVTFAGVRQANQDNENSIVVRSNHPWGVIWRLEGIDIPNPNHFGHRGSSGGGISALSVNVLGNSDFSAGAFSAEYGNALAGVMDMRFRKGNPERAEYRIQAGIVGLDAMVEAPISKEKGSSFLINYRYSTLAIFESIGIQITQPNQSNIFQDLSYNFFFPTGEKSNINFWGLGGYSTERLFAIEDSSEWTRYRDRQNYNFINTTGVTGLTHTYFIDTRSYLKTTLAAGYLRLDWDRDTITIGGPNGLFFEEKSEQLIWTLATNYSRKFNSKLHLKAGIQSRLMGYDFYRDAYFLSQRRFNRTMEGTGNALLLQPYAQLRYRPTPNLTLIGGLHGLLFTINSNSLALDPRLALRYQMGNASINLAYGLHSQMQPLGNYLYLDPTQARPNMDLAFNKAHHIILSYDQLMPANTRLRLETYYQHLFNLAVGADPNSTTYALNSYDDYTLEAQVNAGTAQNYGLDMTLEKFFSNQFFFLVSGSVFKATYVPQNGIRYSTRYDGRFNTSFMGGKEFGFKKGGSLELAGKVLLAGGRRYTAIDQAASIAAYEERLIDEPFTESLDNYFRIDLRIAYRKNKPKYYWMLSLDIQNLTNYQNVRNQEYDPFLNDLFTIYQSDRIPALSFTIDF